MVKPLVRLLFLLLSGIVTTAPVSAQVLQQRPLPAQGKRGELGAPLALPMIRIGNDVLRLAPGGVLYDQFNRTILHAALPPRADVWYTTDPQGDIQRLYVLAPAEQQMLDRRPQR